jgi:hypothetical protein
MTTAASHRNLVFTKPKELSEDKAFEKRKLVINTEDDDNDDCIINLNTSPTG